MMSGKRTHCQIGGSAAGAGGSQPGDAHTRDSDDTHGHNDPTKYKYPKDSFTPPPPTHTHPIPHSPFPQCPHAPPRPASSHKLAPIPLLCYARNTFLIVMAPPTVSVRGVSCVAPSLRNLLGYAGNRTHSNTHQDTQI